MLKLDLRCWPGDSEMERSIRARQERRCGACEMESAEIFAQLRCTRHQGSWRWASAVRECALLMELELENTLWTIFVLERDPETRIPTGEYLLELLEL